MGRKLIEVALPLEKINAESAKEKAGGRHGHPSTLHLWWARRPLAAARAVLFAQLVDDPSARPDEFPTEEDQRVERERLHRMIEDLVVWENTRDKDLLRRAHEEILRSTDGNPPPILDPFAGGGTIPLEAQRLGLEAHASDLNPVAVLINKALIEIPPKFAGLKPVFPGVAESEFRVWEGAHGLAADVRAYGEWMRDEAFKRIGHLYPKATLEDGTKATVIAWIWARTVRCPNPACGIEMPLVRSWWLGKKKGKEAYVVPHVVDEPDDPSGRRVQYTIGHDPAAAPAKETDGTVGRTGTRCIACDAAVPLSYIRAEGRAGRMDQQLMAVVGEGNRRREYVAPTREHEQAANLDRPPDIPEGTLFDWPGRINVVRYGLTEFVDLFTNRQLIALTTFSDLVSEARVRAETDALAAGLPLGDRLSEGVTGAAAYADAVAVYLAMIISRLENKNSSMCGWDSSTKMESVRGVFARQAMPMVWDFAEANPWGGSSGDMDQDIDMIVKVLDALPGGLKGVAQQADAVDAVDTPAVVSTDPPYYDNIGYSDLSDFFYVWLRRSVGHLFPDLFSTLLVPKHQELVANPYRHGGVESAKEFFESGFRKVFQRAREHPTEYPITVYYAFKQADGNAGERASSGWETLLEGMIRSGWAISATWPIRSELGNRMLSRGTNALASSIVLALRPRPSDASVIDRASFISLLQEELPPALRTLQQGAIAPVDLPQATIGPGMAVFSRYSGVLEADGSKMTVRSALARINEILDEVLNEQEGDFGATTRFAIAWYRQHGYTTGSFGDADSLARARNTSVAALDRDEILTSRAGKVTLLKPADLPATYDVTTDAHTSAWEVLHHLIRILGSDGVGAAGAFLSTALARPDNAVQADGVKELAFLLFSIAEKNKWTQDALAFNTLATSWPEVIEASRAAPTPVTQDELTFEE